MDLRLTKKFWVLVALVLGTVTGSDAFTLGRARGTALLGQPLELSVAVQTAADEALPAECFEAEVYYGEYRQDAARIRVNVAETTPGQALSVKVTSFAAVDEPVVTVYLRGGCGQKTTRKYVLLADIASEPANPVSAVTPTVPRLAVSASESRSSVPAAVAASKATPKPDAAAPSRKHKPLDKMVSDGARPPERFTANPSATPTSAKKSRLKLAALDLPEQDPVLRLSNELLSSPVEDLQKRAEAIATWRSLNETAQDVLNEQARMRTVDADLKALRDLTAKNQSLLLELGGRLEKAEAQRYANPLVYGLILLLLVLLAGLAWAWKRLRDANVDPYPWWSGSTDSEHDVHDHAFTPQTLRETVASPHSGLEGQQSQSGRVQTIGEQLPVQRSGLSAVDIDIDVDLEMGPSVFAPVARAEPPTSSTQPLTVKTDGPKSDSPIRDFAHSVAGTLRAINSHELLDVRQQADFFMTLGQYEDAIHLLESDIKNSGESNPLVYLDLLKILHTLSRKEDFERYRLEFNLLFTGEVPDYVAFNQSGNPLDHYPDVCKEITEAWNTSGALEVIEGYLVKSKDGRSPWHFDLEAYRDLLLLHGVAGRIDAASDSVQLPFVASRAPMTMGINEADGLTFDPSASLPAATDTQPLPAVVSSSQSDVDLNLDIAAHNLIDFEVSGFSKTSASQGPK